MAGVIDVAADFYAHFPTIIPMNSGRERILSRTRLALMNSLFLSDEKKAQMEKTLAFLSNQTMEGLQQTLIRENLRFLTRETS